MPKEDWVNQLMTYVSLMKDYRQDYESLDQETMPLDWQLPIT
jgi:hypothetical protein